MLKFMIPGGVLLLLELVLPRPVQAMDIVGHRGASYDAPENTLASIRMAFAQGADAAELDIHLTKDGRIVVIHDPDTKRTAGKNLVVAESEAKALKALDVGRFKDKKFSGEQIPLLSEVLDILPEGKKLLVEIKCGTEILGPLEKVLKESGKASQVSLMGFDLGVVAAAKSRFPNLRVLWLAKSEKEPTAGNYLPYAKETVEEAHAKGLNGLGLHFGGVDAEIVRAAHKAGLKIFVWAVDDPTDAKNLEALAIDALITNRPGWMREQLQH